MESNPMPKATKNEAIMATVGKFIGCCETQISYTSKNNDKRIIGMLIKNENFATSFLSPPQISPVAIVLPEREIPGNTANPCATPIKNAVLKFRLLLVFFAKTVSLNNKLNAEIRKQIGKKFPPKDVLINGIRTIAINPVGIVATTKEIVSFEKGCLIRLNMSL